ncbi:hypothetical protein DSM106972_017080 [Dulcicalothrix desertica PCC 7102]|uniref:Putative restriction endonuclease domain-containing protein n=1 Tax=Dulcicalothrix desertica PCC 7102 TaxID=232991 RepID=A0A3S1ATE0_9CYAN|nr:Uma2 family endonuclease [Dulcicalothrix desertica]RUT08540.1 hypothetical protein DSM106972_017080 [Dulcicalothrix desertica PCC 7102]TWH44020.1 Uma2 family endonuclease [Dulcicalothrix desertica PCC 7102]
MVNVTIVSESFNNFSLEDWTQNPLDDTEWVNGKLIEKNGMTLKHSQSQSRLDRRWGNYKDESGLGGEVYTDVPCLTNIQGRRPDVAYLTPALVSQYGNQKVLPQSFPLSAEIVSPTDYAEEVIAKSAEYLQSGGEEVWLIYPENRWIIIVTKNSRLIFSSGETVSTQTVLLDFSMPVDDLFN